MTHYESAIDDIATRLQGTDASLTTSIADILAAALQELIEAELTGTIGAEPGERSPARTAQRNGHRPKLLSTPAGDLDVGIPKLRKAASSPSCSSRAGGSTRRCGR
jgi:putative transposase